MKRSLYLMLIFLLVVSFGILGCEKKEAKEIKIGVIFPLTGDAAIWGQNDKEGADLATEEINNPGGITGKKIRLIYEDSQANPGMGVSAFKKLIEVEKVPAVIGDIASSVTLAIAPIAQEKRVVLLSPGATAPKLSEAGPYFFRIWNSDAEEGEKLQTLLITTLESKKLLYFI